MVKHETMTIVSIVKHDNIRFAVRRAIQLLGGIKAFVQPRDKVVIKPNLVFGLPPFTGFTTDYPIVEAIIELCQQMNPSEVLIAEGSGGIETKLAFRTGGYSELAKKYNVKLVDLNKSPTRRVIIPDGKAVQELLVPILILDSDVLINVPKLKLYKRVPGQRDWASLAVKNLLGTIPGKGKYSDRRPDEFPIECSPEFYFPEGKLFHPDYRQWWSPRGERKRIHRNLVEGLVDINKVIKPALNVLDAFMVSDDINMTTTKAKPPFELCTILASRDPLALDCIAVKISGIDPFDTLYLKHAAERGIGESDYNKIQVKGTALKTIIETWKQHVDTPVS